ncbi:hypothetical protein DTO027B5_3571 [Paecilomyces variotii]|nr:hypothetical protein DTO032I3_8397 [Paecilomyces variotii]KAJ9273712.1 hypothetical protein DTO212C5_346 [Paecilomyces variotii]KAJ9274319.1 hypothetical protein DTO021D3_8790 [Paecilomyces variotii]KAJ9283413.1 hypothetical protein DTO021C3_9018 [Paecilomyces variotii]KAJ9327882.1 hypothetical protein DTO027B3_1590 [Paecilomyces variotii]
MRGFRVIAHPSQLALFSTGETFTVLGNLPFPMRLFQSFRRHISAWLRLQTPSRYIRHQCRDQCSRNKALVTC